VPELLTILISGLLMGCIYALLAGGLTLIWGVMGIVNLAHGEALMLGCFAALYFFAGTGLAAPLAILPFAPIFFLLGVLLYVGIIRRIVGAPELMSLLLTFGLSILIKNVAVLVWGGELRIASYLEGSFQVAGIFISKARLVAGLIAIAISLGMYAFLKYTRQGQAIRAVAFSRPIAEQCGINANVVYMTVFGLGTALAAVAGILAGTIFAFTPLVGEQFILKAFAITVLGGMGNFLGALVAALLLGVIEQSVTYFIDAQISAAAAFVIIILTLLFRPQGILGTR
jgi:branched-chain amino acid transport system permease protein